MGVGVLGVNSVSDDELLRARYGDAEANEDTDGSMEEDFDAIVDFESVGAADAIDWAESVLGRPHSSPPMDGGTRGVPPLRRRVRGSAMATTIAAAAAQR